MRKWYRNRTAALWCAPCNVNTPPPPEFKNYGLALTGKKSSRVRTAYVVGTFVSRRAVFKVPSTRFKPTHDTSAQSFTDADGKTRFIQNGRILMPLPLFGTSGGNGKYT